MKLDANIPKEYQQYNWIAERFSSIAGVEMVGLEAHDHGTEVNLFITNNKPGKQNVVFKFPLRTVFFVDYTAAPGDCPHEYDINQYEGAEHILKIAEAKAKVMFGAVRMN